MHLELRAVAQSNPNLGAGAKAAYAESFRLCHQAWSAPVATVALNMRACLTMLVRCLAVFVAPFTSQALVAAVTLGHAIAQSSTSSSMRWTLLETRGLQARVTLVQSRRIAVPPLLLPPQGLLAGSGLQTRHQCLLVPQQQAVHPYQNRSLHSRRQNQRPVVFAKGRRLQVYGDPIQYHQQCHHLYGHGKHHTGQPRNRLVPRRQGPPQRHAVDKGAKVSALPAQA
mmetsp:Transcript_63821/g.118619  ORF Transcript_63821/g.118619 Transcript_63821/m.118619 type:complete len:226 (+) Transcript_63821:727-1404(+)